MAEQLELREQPRREDHRLQQGDRVVTVKPAVEPSGYMPGARSSNRWGVAGVVVRSSDAHGLCYLVRHGDGTEGWYEPGELRPHG